MKDDSGLDTQDDKGNRAKVDQVYLKRFFWTSIGIILFCVVYGVAAFCIDKNIKFGDLFGALAAMFSGLAFAGIIFTILQQKTELRLQRDELRLARGEFKLTRKEFEAQNQTMRKQRFENTFFNLISQHNQVIRESNFREQGPIDMNVVSGHNAFRSAHAILIGKSINEIISFKTENGYPLPINADKNDLTIPQREKFVMSLIEPWHTKNPHNLHLYFLSLKRILKFIHRSLLLDSKDERIFYASLLKDQISYYEQPVILYYSLLPVTWIKSISFYVHEYKLLDEIDTESLITIQDKQMFDEWANKSEPAE